MLVRRDTSEKQCIKFGVLSQVVDKLLNEIQQELYNRSKHTLISLTHRVEDYEEFKELFTQGKGFVRAGWCGNPQCEENIKYETKVTTRCLTSDGEGVSGRCIYCGKRSENEWIFAKSY